MLTERIFTNLYELPCELTEHEAAVSDVKDHVIRSVSKSIVLIVINRPLLILVT